MRVGRRGWTGGVGFAAALVGLVIALGADYDAPRLGARALEAVSAASGARLAASRFSLTPLRGLTIGGVTAAVRGSLGRADATVEELFLESRWWPILRGRIEIDALDLRRPGIEWVPAQDADRSTGEEPRAAQSSEPAGGATASPGDGPRPAKAHTAWGPAVLDVGRLGIHDGTLVIRSPEDGSVIADLEDVDLQFARRDTKGATAALAVGPGGAGDLRVARVATRGVDGRDLAARLTLARGIAVLQPLDVTTSVGRLTGGVLRADLTAAPSTYELSVQGRGLDVTGLLAASNRIAGPAALELRVSGRADSWDGLRGAGVITLEQGRLPAMPLLQRLEGWAHLQLVGQAYRPTRVRFSVEGSQVVFEPFDLSTDDVHLAFGGGATLGGPLALTLTLRVRREVIEAHQLPQKIVTALTDGEGFVRVPLKVSGTLSNPLVALDATGAIGLLEQGLAGSGGRGGRALPGTPLRPR